jgi:MFS family permease
VADLKWAFTAFAVAYAVFEVPCAWLGDTFGPRQALFRIVLWWSVCTALTGAVGLRVGGVVLGGLGTLVTLRFLFGMGEAGAYPNITRAVHNWFSVAQRGRAQGVVWMSGRLMGGLTPLVWAVLVSGTAFSPPLASWRWAFGLFGALGLVWAVLFALGFSDRPSSAHAADRERAALPDDSGQSRSVAVPWRSFLRSGNLWLLCLMYFCMAYAWYFNITYLPSCLRDVHAVDDRSVVGALFKGGPLWIGAAGCLLGGWLTDALGERWGDRRKARRRLATVAFLVGAAAFAVAPWANSAAALFAALSLAAFCGDLTVAAAWATCQDVGQRFAATAAACMNTIGTVGAATAGWATGTLLEAALARGATDAGRTVVELGPSEKAAAYAVGYALCFGTFAVAYLVAAACWQWIDPNRPIVPDASRGPPSNLG